jgi:iron(III) transport system substrate-binding protein
MRWWWLVVVAASLLGCAKARPRVVLYCAQDREFAEGLLASFTKQTGIAVDARFDTESTKSVSLYEALVREKGRPRCDVFWNNEIILTLRLDEQGLLAAYASPRAADYPAWTRAPKQTWQAFAARARILMVNQEVAQEQRPKTLEELLQPRWRGKVAMAKPLFGTTAAHMACLTAKLGEAAAERLFIGLKQNAAVLAGNKDVAEAVAAGRYAVGLTDTDDAIIQVRRGLPVTIVYPDQNGMGTLFLPNTLSLIQGCPNPAAGKELIDYLLSPAVERALAEGPSAQIPLNPKVEARLDIATPKTAKAMEVDFARAARDWEATQTKLRSLFAR